MSVHPGYAMATSSPAVVHRSPWHTPVPYFFGGLAAVMGLIAFALFILACTYLNPVDDDQNDGDGDRDLEAGDAKSDDHKQEFTVVIMAGETKPTFLATHITSGASSFGGYGCRSNLSESESEKVKQRSNDQLQLRNTENQESPDRLQ